MTWHVKSDEPEPHKRPGGPDVEAAWLWRLARSSSEGGTTIVAITDSAMMEIMGGEAPESIDLENAYRTKGRSLIQPYLTRGERPPKLIQIDRKGEITTSDDNQD
jgi:hypothetical protein